MARLPLFPLGTVLYPGAVLPLHVFEPRYVALIQELLAAPEAEREFGVIAIRQGHEVGPEAMVELYDVGTAARLERTNLLDEDRPPRYVILATGTRRFRLDSLDSEAGTPYFSGNVTWLDEPQGERANDLAHKVREDIHGYWAELGAQGRDLPTAPQDLSYAVPAAMVLDLGDRQSLLACPDTSSRLDLTAQLLTRERGLLGEFNSVPSTTDLGGIALN